ncbi:GDSL-type esterase/lipase family protein [Streptomyces sp. NPDC056470]|uniref:GDSL-type esterase/lipase family protein n=1 Tax=Streptomyces sp. NPDC056470 TaxID=3345831 RepID=UPI0036A8658C
MMHRKAVRSTLSVLATLTAAGAMIAQGFTGHASATEPPPGQPNTAIVSLGDSYVAGEGGRWAGNPFFNTVENRNIADRGTFEEIYGSTANYTDSAGREWQGGCHRSDSALVHRVTGVTHKINLACSGAESKNIWKERLDGTGGKWFKGEKPQADQLADVARQYQVKAVVLSIGGNDLGFFDIIKACVSAWVFSQEACYVQQEPATRNKVDAIKVNVGRAIDDIKQVMSDAGYAPGSYKLMVHDYPNPLPDVPQLSNQRDLRGCPLWSSDIEWVHRQLIPRMAGAVMEVAMSKGAQFLDVSKAFAGHELCNAGAEQVNGAPEPVETAEWVNKLHTPQATPSFSVNEVVESFHPNYYGQLALGDCVNMAYNASGGSGHWTCTNQAGAGGRNMSIVGFGKPGGPSYMQTGEKLSGSQCKYSPAGTTRMCMLTNGVLAVQTGPNFSTTLWDTHETLMIGLAAKFHEGHLWVENASGAIVWTNQAYGNPGAYLRVQDDGRVVLYNILGFPLWSTTYPPGYVPPPPGA